MKSYRPLFRIDFGHDYYNLRDGVCKDFELIPFRRSRVLMEKNDLRLVEDPRGFVAYYGTEAPRSPGVYSLFQEPFAKLSFRMVLKTPYFFNFSALPFTALQTRKFYFHNLRELSTPPAPGQAPQLLPALEDPDGQVGGSHLLPIQPPVFHTIVRGEPTQLHVVVKDVFDRVLFEGEVATDQEANGETGQIIGFQLINNALRTDFRQVPPGKYSLIINGEAPQHFLVHPAEEMRAADFGMLDVYLGPAGKNPSPFLRSEAEKAPVNIPGAGEGGLPAGLEIRDLAYGLRFERRKTKWRYFIVNRADPEFERYDYRIKNSPEPDEDLFPNQVAIDLPRGQKALQIVSSKPLDLKEHLGVDEFFHLEIGKKNGGNGRGGGRLVRLPAPDIKILKAERMPSGLDQSKDRYFSDIYVYV